jgi:hypothetical protein
MLPALLVVVVIIVIGYGLAKAFGSARSNGA